MEVDELLRQVDLVRLASEFTDLEQRGQEWWGISPITWPRENTPSFSIRQVEGEVGRYYDFSSGKGGTAISLLKICKKLTSYQAVQELKKFAGITDDVNVVQRNKMQATICCRKFMKPVTKSKEAKITILPDNYMERYEFDADKLQIWEDEGISFDSMNRFQVRYDSFSNQIVYPIRNPDGKICNIGCRTLDPDWKAKGYHKYSYRYGWGKMQTIYGFAENLEYIKEQRQVILFEGCKSVLKADSWGIHNCGALLTSHLNPEQMKILAKLGCDVVFMLDREVKIREDHNINKLKRYVNVYYYIDYDGLLNEKDAPVDQGCEVFKTLLDNKIKYK